MDVTLMMTGSLSEKGFIKTHIIIELEFGKTGLLVSYIYFCLTLTIKLLILSKHGPTSYSVFFWQSRAHIDEIGMKYLIKLCYSHQASPNQNQCWSFMMEKPECSSWSRQGETK